MKPSNARDFCQFLEHLLSAHQVPTHSAETRQVPTSRTDESFCSHPPPIQSIYAPHSAPLTAPHYAPYPQYLRTSLRTTPLYCEGHSLRKYTPRGIHSAPVQSVVRNVGASSPQKILPIFYRITVKFTAVTPSLQQKTYRNYRISGHYKSICTSRTTP
jgi:hypothetical protein